MPQLNYIYGCVPVIVTHSLPALPRLSDIVCRNDNVLPSSIKTATDAGLYRHARYQSINQHSLLQAHAHSITRTVAIAKRPCDCCIILKSGSYTKAI